MDLVASTGSFLFGGVSAVMILGLLFHFLHRPRRRVRDDQFLQQIADALLPGPECKKPAGMLKVKGAETAETQEIEPEEGFSPGRPPAAPGLGMSYTPVSDLR